MKIAVFDIDKTLFDTHKWGNVLQSLWQEMNIAPQVIDELIAKIRPQGFSFTKLIRILREELGNDIDDAWLLQKIDAISGDYNQYIYDDVEPTLSLFERHQWQLWSLSFGDPAFQTKYKIERTLLKEIFPVQRRLFTSKPGEKSLEIHKLIQDSHAQQCLFVDDHPEELESIHHEALVTERCKMHLCLIDRAKVHTNNDRYITVSLLSHVSDHIVL